MKSTLLFSIAIFVSITSLVSAELIRGVNIDFVTIGNPGNLGDTRDGQANPYGCGAVGYEYQIGKYEITNAQWSQFVALVGAPTGYDGGYTRPPTFTGANQPTNNVSWYEAVQFCNFLTSGDKSKGVYRFNGNNSNPGRFLGIDRDNAISAYGTAYVLPTEDEWYKAAYYTGNGYSLYANGLNTIPAPDNGWNYAGGSYSSPWNVGTGSEEQNGTFDMMGNVGEWTETLDYSLDRIFRGSSYGLDEYYLMSSIRETLNPYGDSRTLGFRIASIPEPCTLMLLALGSLMLRKR